MQHIIISIHSRVNTTPQSIQRAIGICSALKPVEGWAEVLVSTSKSIEQAGCLPRSHPRDQLSSDSVKALLSPDNSAGTRRTESLRCDAKTPGREATEAMGLQFEPWRWTRTKRDS